MTWCRKSMISVVCANNLRGKFGQLFKFMKKVRKKAFPVLLFKFFSESLFNLCIREKTMMYNL